MWAFAAGVAAGLATLMRPSWLLFVPFALAAGVFWGSRKRHWAMGAVMLAGLAAAMAPWWIRNAHVTGHFVPTTLQVGASLYDGLNPQANGASEMQVVDRQAAEARQQLLDAGVGPEALEYRLDRRLRDDSLAWAGQHPGRAAQLVAIKFVRLWNVWPNERAFSAWPLRLAVLVTYVPILVLAVYGAVRTCRLGWPYLLCWLPAVYFTLLHVVFVSSIRYRQPALLLLIVLACGVVVRWRAAARGGAGVSDSSPFVPRP